MNQETQAPKKISEFNAVLPIFDEGKCNTVNGLVKEIKFCSYDQLEQFQQELWPIAVAAFDTSLLRVYVVDAHPYANHGELIETYDLPNTYQDDLLNGEVLYGFITASGHFLNRTEAAKWVEKLFPGLIKKPIDKDTGRLISSNIDWGLAKTHLVHTKSNKMSKRPQ
jgi:hypothetical protein